MSKTIRRKIFKTKNKPYIPYFNDKELYKFYSDKIDFSAPKWFRKLLNKKFRVCNNINLYNLNKSIYYDKYLFIPFKKTADYNYW